MGLVALCSLSVHLEVQRRGVPLMPSVGWSEAAQRAPVLEGEAAHPSGRGARPATRMVYQVNNGKNHMIPKENDHGDVKNHMFS